MPKPRIIDPGFFDDLNISRLPIEARLLLIGMIVTCADDEGRLRASPEYLRKQIFGYDQSIGHEQVVGWRKDILKHCEHGLVLYEVGYEQYLWFRNWEKFQKIRYVIKSKLPAPPQDGAEGPEPLRESAADLQVDSPSVEKSSIEKSSVEAQLQLDATGAVYTAWQKARGLLVNAIEAEEVGHLIDEFGAEAVLTGITAAVKGNKRDRVTLNYLTAILRNPRSTARDSPVVVIDGQGYAPGNG